MNPGQNGDYSAVGIKAKDDSGRTHYFHFWWTGDTCSAVTSIELNDKLTAISAYERIASISAEFPIAGRAGDIPAQRGKHYICALARSGGEHHLPVG